MKNIVIVGAGFAGITAALKLEQAFKNNTEVSVVLVDKHDYHLFSPKLVSVATSDEELVSVLQIKKSVALPIKEIVGKKQISFVQGALTGISRTEKYISVGIKKIPYDFLVLATGAQVGFDKIENAEKYSLSLQSLSDALRVRNALEFSIQSHSHDIQKRLLRFVVAGDGGLSPELAGELKKMLNFLSWKYSYPQKYLEIVVIASTGSLVSYASDAVNEETIARITDLGIKFLSNQKIIKVEPNFAYFLNGEKVQFEQLLWVGKLSAPNLPDGFFDGKTINSFVGTDEFLRLKNSDNIFVIGDLARLNNNIQQLGLSTDYQNAVNQGEYLAKVLPVWLKNKKPSVYVSEKHSYIIKIFGKWAIYITDKFYFTGYFAYLFGIFLDFKYFARLFGIKKAFKYIIRETDYFSRTD